MKKVYESVKRDIMVALEEIPAVRSTTSAQYLKALKEIHEEVDNWFEASIEAAKDDVRRADESAQVAGTAK